MIQISSIDLDKYRLDGEQKLWVYCGLDNCLTHEVGETLRPQLNPKTSTRTYRFERAMQAPALAMMRRGMLVDQEAMHLALYGDPSAVANPKEHDGDAEKAEVAASREREGLLARLARLSGLGRDAKGKTIVVDETAILQQYANAIWGKGLNYNSPKQLQEILYTALSIPPVVSNKKGKSSVTTDRKALEWLIDNYPRAEPLCRVILQARDLEGLIEVLTKGLDADGHMRCSYQVAGTETGRWSSSTSVFNTGTNLQNITYSLRRIFIPKPGYVFCNVDLEQAESRGVAYLSGDERYIEACESADLHTTVAHMVFGIPNVKSEAERPYYRHFTYRDMAKRAGHGLNYGLTPASLARHMKITVKEAFRMYMRYLGGELPETRAHTLELMDLPHTRLGKLVQFPGAFPGIRAWHETTRLELETEGELTTPLGRRRQFWQRLNDSSTLREAIAYRPQSMIGDLLNIALWRVWNELESDELHILGQVHDSIMFEVLENSIDKLMPRVLECMRNPVQINGRTLVIPAEVKIGRNWRDTKKWKVHGV